MSAPETATPVLPAARAPALQAARDGKAPEPADPGARFLLGPWLVALEQSPEAAAWLDWSNESLQARVSVALGIPSPRV